jgi:predicted protein tyrosine phosphatase
MRGLVLSAAVVALASVNLSSSASAESYRVPPTELAALQSHRYSIPADAAFHAALATLQTLGFQDINADRDSGTINAVTDSKAKTILNFFWGFGKKKWTEKAQLLVEDYAGGSQVRLSLSLKETKSRGIFGTSFTDGELVRYAQPYQDFFAALDSEVGRRGGAVGMAAATAQIDAAGNIQVGGGVQLVPAKTLSGYCIKAAPGYMGTGAANSPAITSARPLCT